MPYEIAVTIDPGALVDPVVRTHEDNEKHWAADTGKNYTPAEQPGPLPHFERRKTWWYWEFMRASEGMTSRVITRKDVEHFGYQPVENFEYRGFTHKTSVTTERNWLAIKEAENGLYNVDLHYTRGIYELNTLEGVHRIDPVVHTILPGVSLDQAIAELQAFEERYKASGIGKPEREYTHNVMGGKGKLTIKHAQGTVNFSKSWRPSSHWSHFLRVATPATPA